MNHIALKILIIILMLLIGSGVYFHSQFEPDPDPQFGLSFSIPYAEYLGFDWKTMYLDMLNDLQPRRLRLMAYWEMIEPEPDLFYLQDVEEMLAEAERQGIEVILVLGHKQPRWPECHHPGWYGELSAEEQTARLFHMLRVAVEHFQKYDSVQMWQIENEPFFEFGPECPRVDESLARQEVSLVKGLDSRPVILTDSGEKGSWVATANLGADVFGVTMYRTVHHHRFGYHKYPLPAWVYRLRAGWLRTFSDVDQIIGVELQAEPWFTGLVSETGLETQFSLMNSKIFRENIEYARKVGFRENYLWGAEWWYWLAHAQNDWGMWEAAKNLLREKEG